MTTERLQKERRHSVLAITVVRIEGKRKNITCADESDCADAMENISTDVYANLP